MVTRGTSLPDEVASALSAAGIPADEETLAKLSRFAEILLEVALPRGFIGPQEAERLVPRHITESAAVSLLLSPGDRITDVGSGAGLPGLVLACMGWEVDVIEVMDKRADFLEETVAAIGLKCVNVHAVRAEDAGRSHLREQADVVVARALAAPPVALELCLPLARTGGKLFVLTTPEAAGAADLGAIADQLGAEVPVWEELSVPGADPPRCVMIVHKVRQTPDRFPRRAGVPKRRPLG